MEGRHAGKTHQQRTKSDRPVGQARPASAGPAHPLLDLQAAIGNQQLHRLLESGPLQAKLKINKPEDEHGQEADRVADAVMRMPEPSSASEDEGEKEMQMKPAAGSLPLEAQMPPPETEQGEEPGSLHRQPMEPEEEGGETAQALTLQAQPEEEAEEEMPPMQAGTVPAGTLQRQSRTLSPGRIEELRQLARNPQNFAASRGNPWTGRGSLSLAAKGAVLMAMDGYYGRAFTDAFVAPRD